MMRIAALYDIHGNLPALEAVLEEVRREGVDGIVVGGDIVPGPMPRECVSVLLGLSIPVRFIQGNGERDLLSWRRGEVPARVPEQFHHVLRWVADALPREHLAAFAAWPSTTRLPIPGLGDILFCHATPRDDNELFTRLTPEDRLRPVFEAVDSDVVICGHTHMQFDRRVGGVRVVNAGSVGLPFGDPGACWALLGSDIALRRTAYDLDEAARRIGATEYPRIADFDVQRPPAEAAMLAAFEAAALR